jgi:exonuclease SbcC
VREIGGTDVTLTTRLDEAGLLLGELVGMSSEQFCQVVLLPQGQFAEFLRADAESRRPLLEKLFGTARFSAVESFLAERRRDTRRSVEDADAEVDRLLARMSQAAGDVAVPEDARGERARSWASGLLTAALSAADASVRRATDAARELDAARGDAARTAALAVVHRRATALTARSERLAAGAGRREADRRRLAAARAAAPVAALGTAHARAEAVAAAAVEASQLAVERLLASPGDVPGLRAVAAVAPSEVSPELLRGIAAAAHAEAVRLSELSTDERELDRLVVEDAAVRAAQEENAATLRADRSLLGEAPATRQGMADRVRLSQAAVAERPGLERELATLESRLRAARERDRLAAQLDEVREADYEARAGWLAARQCWLDARQRRLDGMAVELAAGLVEGTDCPVCGSPEHPRPAAPDPARDGKAVPARRPLATRRPPPRPHARRGGCRRRVVDQADDVARGRGGRRRASRLGRRRRRRPARRSPRAAATPARRGPRGSRRTRHAGGRSGSPRRGHRAASSGRAGTRAHPRPVPGRDRWAEQPARRAHRAAGGGARQRSVAVRAARQAAGSAGSVDRRRPTRSSTGCGRPPRPTTRSTPALPRRGSPVSPISSTARAAVLAPAEIAELEAALAADDAELTAVREQLAEPDIAAAVLTAPPDETSVAATVRAATRVYDEAVTERHSCTSRVTALERLAVELDHRLAVLAPLQAEQRLVERLSCLVEGTSTDNALRMRLSSYVLAARLEQVAAAATERLLQMSVGRYSLEHTDEVGGRGRSGLGLRVCDAWTGVARSPATLSGGESFVASLALALALADVVTAEAGGAPLDTLFIDEGFGTLDEDCLDEVIDVLDALREGGRTVGVVSHVAELRQRVPAQVRVLKASTGSTVELVGVAGPAERSRDHSTAAVGALTSGAA